MWHWNTCVHTNVLGYKVPSDCTTIFKGSVSTYPVMFSLGALPACSNPWLRCSLNKCILADTYCCYLYIWGREDLKASWELSLTTLFSPGSDAPSWQSPEKRLFLLLLPQEKDLLGVSESFKWARTKPADEDRRAPSEGLQASAAMITLWWPQHA